MKRTWITYWTLAVSKPLSVCILMLMSLSLSLSWGQNSARKFVNVTQKVPLPLQLGNSSAAWADYDGDGLQDIFIFGEQSTYYNYAWLLHNTGDGWENKTNLIPELSGGLKLGSVSWADYDKDGRPDLLLTGDYGYTTSYHSSVLYHNTKDNGFVDVTAKVVPDLPQLVNSSAAWGDINKDGWLDLVITGSDRVVFTPGSNLFWSTTIGVYINIEGKLFENVTNFSASAVQSMEVLPTGSVTLIDFNTDGRLDLALSGIQRGPDETKTIVQFYPNAGTLGPYFPSNGSYFKTTDYVPEDGSMAWGDYDNDGKVDLIITGPGDNTFRPPTSKLFHNTGQGFEDVTAQLIPKLPQVSYSGQAWFDFNKDGRLDLFISGEKGAGGEQISRLFQNTGSGFIDVTDQVMPEISHFAFKSVSVADYDKDGWPDLLLTGTGTTFIYHNQVQENLSDGPEPTLQLLAPVYTCQSGAITFQTRGGNGSPIEFMAPGITAWTANPNQFVDQALRTAADAQPITLTARQNGQLVYYVWDIRAVCPVAPSDRLQLLAPVYTCQSGAITFQTRGGNGSPIEFMAPGITAWTANPNQFVDQELRTATDARPITLTARQLTSNGDYNEDRYVWDLRAVCPVSSARARLGAVEPRVGLQVSVFPNPVDDEFSILIEGAQQQSVRLLVTDLQGRALVDKDLVVEQPSHSEQVRLGRVNSGVYLLRVSTSQNSQTLKLIKGR